MAITFSRWLAVIPQNDALWDRLSVAPMTKITAENADKFLTSRGVTPQGIEWFKAATDPFHDMEMHLQGLPDTSAEFSVVQKQVHSHNITAPGAGVWDLLVVFLPFIMKDQHIVMDLDLDATGAIRHTATAQRGYIGTLVTIAVPTGTNMTDIPALVAAGATMVGHPVLTDGTIPTRLIAGGFEIVNTTAPLYKSGAVTVGSMACILSKGHVALQNLESATVGDWDGYRFKCWPDTIDEAMMHPSSVTWQADKGCYVPYRFNSLNIPFQQPVGRGLSTATFMSTTNTTVGGEQGPASSGFFAQDMAMSWAYFTGLSPETTLRLVHNAYLELSPSWSIDPTTHNVTTSALLPNATPPAPYDPKALELYGRTIVNLPVGIPRTMNPSGEWWAKFVLKGAKIALDVMTPIAQIIDPMTYGIPGVAVSAGKAGLLLGETATNAIFAAKKKKAAARRPAAAAKPNPAPRLPQNAGRVMGGRK